MILHPQGLKGPWQAGIVLDWHTTASEMIGHNEFGYPIFDNTRSEVGELLYQFKYRNDHAALQKIVRAVVKYIGNKAKGKFDLILPIPHSNPTRTVTKQLAQRLATALETDFSDSALMKCKNTSELKSIQDPEQRKQILEGAFCVDKHQIESKSVLLVDDIYRSGATLEAAAEAVAAQSAVKIYVLAITHTRVLR